MNSIIKIIILFFCIIIFGTPVFSDDSVLKTLPVVEVLTQEKNDYFLILLSGDGGWKDIDKQLSGYFNNAGISVIGFNCFSYFSKKEKTPEETANDIDKVINFYLKKLNKKHVVIMGYSFGADLVPFIYNRLPESTLISIKKLILLGITKTAQFKIDVKEFVGIRANIKRYPTVPELSKITNLPVFCICGDKDKTAACMFINQSNAKIKTVPGGHHFNNDYKFISGMIIDFLNE